MAISEEQSKSIKEQLLKQLSNFPEDRRTEIKEQINSMTPEQIENFVNQNNLGHLGDSCIFCSIVNGENKSFKIAEDETNIAVLELNPLSKGHSLIIPKLHSGEIKLTTKNFAEKVANLLRAKFNPREVKTNELEIMGHKLLEVIPIYGNETDRKQVSEDILSNLLEELTSFEEKKLEEKIDEKPEIVEIPKLKTRIP